MALKSPIATHGDPSKEQNFAKPPKVISGSLEGASESGVRDLGAIEDNFPNREPTRFPSEFFIFYPRIPSCLRRDLHSTTSTGQRLYLPSEKHLPSLPKLFHRSTNFLEFLYRHDRSDLSKKRDINF
ncbi:hypothetical protein ES319_A01G123900v1 [Gossypium barbadense]|uniref:Uncharacterized protein n=2 Tax=Gossypium TaxID=3633 RepID=A0A5J5WWU0_GOSBA|nr:hypothetical protein ES319_A01G123900v1 [Gossypium barbadense]TYH30928.1 hypothetical protein ES288_A01G134000v1 [Gossypium darwinii]